TVRARREMTSSSSVPSPVDAHRVEQAPHRGDGRGDHDLGPSVTGARVRGDRRTATDGLADRHRHLEDPSTPVGDDLAVRDHPQVPATLAEARSDAADDVADRPEALLPRSGDAA